MGLIPGSGRSGEGNGYPLQYSCLGNPVARGAWWATVHGVIRESSMTWQLNSYNKLALRSHDSQSFLISEPEGPDCELGWFYSKIMRI